MVTVRAQVHVAHTLAALIRTRGGRRRHGRHVGARARGGNEQMRRQLALMGVAAGGRRRRRRQCGRRGRGRRRPRVAELATTLGAARSGRRVVVGQVGVVAAVKLNVSPHSTKKPSLNKDICQCGALRPITEHRPL